MDAEDTKLSRMDSLYRSMRGLLDAVKTSFAVVNCFMPAESPFEFETLPSTSTSERVCVEVIAVYAGPYKSLIRQITSSVGKESYAVDYVVDGKTSHIDFANFQSFVKATEVAIVIAALGPDRILKIRD